MRVGLSCDLFRDGGGAERHAAWLWDALLPLLQAHGHTVVAHTAQGHPAPHRSRTATWPRLYADPALRGPVLESCRPLLGCGLVIGHELSPNQLHVLHRAGRPTLDISIDPIRFGPDLFLRLRTNDPALARHLAALHVPRAELAPMARALRAACAPLAGLPGPALLFAGQTDADASLIEGARLRTAAEFHGAIRAALRPGLRLLIKPHPYAAANADVRALHQAIPGSLIVNDNIYALLCAPAVQGVLTLSSGVAAEASLLGLPATRLLQPDRDTAAPPLWTARIPPGALPGLLAAHLGRQPSPVAPASATLRHALGQAWGYAEAPRLGQRTVFGGQAIAFGTAGTGTDLCTFGWSPPEAGGRWSEGALATLLLQPQTPGLTLRLQLSAFVPPGAAAVRLTISGGADGPHPKAFYNGRRSWLTIRLPATPGPVELVLHVTGHTSPAAHGLSADARQLGIMLHQARLFHVAAFAAHRRRASLTARRCAYLAVQCAWLFASIA